MKYLLAIIFTLAAATSAHAQIAIDDMPFGDKPACQGTTVDASLLGTFGNPAQNQTFLKYVVGAKSVEITSTQDGVTVESYKAWTCIKARSLILVLVQESGGPLYYSIPVAVSPNAAYLFSGLDDAAIKLEAKDAIVNLQKNYAKGATSVWQRLKK